jgi:hypothetical protein
MAEVHPGISYRESNTEEEEEDVAILPKLVSPNCARAIPSSTGKT